MDIKNILKLLMVLIGGLLVLAVFIIALPFILLGLIIFFLIPRKQSGFRFFSNLKSSPYATFNQNPRDMESSPYTVHEDDNAEIIDIQAKEVDKTINTLSK